MNHLRELFRDLMLSNIRTYIQTGNVFVKTSKTDCDDLNTRIEEHLFNVLDYEIAIFLARLLNCKIIYNLIILKKLNFNIRLTLAFTHNPLQAITSLPMNSPKNDMEILAVTSGEIFLVIRLINGKMDNIAAFLKLAFHANPTVTTRFYSTTIKILQAAQNI